MTAFRLPIEVKVLEIAVEYRLNLNHFKAIHGSTQPATAQRKGPHIDYASWSAGEQQIKSIFVIGSPARPRVWKDPESVTIPFFQATVHHRLDGSV